MIIRKVDAADSDIISDLHLSSWRSAYRGILADTYLDHDLTDERRAWWKERFNSPDLAARHHVFLAEENDEPSVLFV